MIIGDNDAFHIEPSPAILKPHTIQLFAALILIAIYLLLTSATTSFAADQKTLVLDGPMTTDQLVGKIHYLIDKNWSLTLPEILDQKTDGFSPVKSGVPNFGYTRSKIWLRVKLRNADKMENQWRIHFHENFKQILKVQIVRGDGSIETQLDLNTDSGFDDRPIRYPQMVAPVMIAPGESVEVFVDYWSEGSSELPLSIETASSFSAVAASRGARNYVFYGMTMILIVIALLCLLIFKEPVFLAYVAYSGSTLLYILHGDGVAFQYLWPNYPGFNSVASVVAGSSLIIFGANYARVFLGTARYHPVINKLLLAVIVATLVMDVGMFFLDRQLLKRLFVLMALITVASCMLSGLVASRRRFKQVRFYVLAWGGAVISASIMTLRHWLGFEISQDLQYDSMRFVMVFDATMMGLAIADRYHQLRQSRQQAVRDNLAQTERNLMLNNRLHDLEQKFSHAVEIAQNKDEEIQNTVHDLRQPLHALRLNVRNMIVGSTDNTGTADNIEATFKYLENLVSGHLQDPAQYLAGTGTNGAGTDVIGVQETLQGIHEMFLPDAEAKELEFRFLQTSLETAVKPLVLMRIVSNLVANAIKYTPHGKLLVGTRKRGNDLCIEIHDTGTGLSVEEFEIGKQRSKRLDKNADNTIGEGYGLTIASDLARQHGYKLVLEKNRTTGTGIVLKIPMLDVTTDGGADIDQTSVPLTMSGDEAPFKHLNSPPKPDLENA